MKKLTTAMVLTSLIATLASAQTSSDEFSRAGKWEVYGFGQFASIFNVLESNARLGGGGLGAGYNLGEHFELNGDLSLSSAKFDIQPLFESDTVVWSTLYMGNIGLDYNLLTSRVTPVIGVRAGVGWFSQGVGTAFDETLGVGVRWDATDHMFAKAMLNAGVWENTNQDHKGWFSLGLSVALGYRF